MLPSFVIYKQQGECSMEWGAIIVAAGRGTRMGMADNKPYLKLIGDQPVLAYSLLAFEQCASISTIAIVVAAGEEQLATAVVRQLGLRKVAAIVPGGAERQDSVFNGLSVIQTEGVLIHDAARPLITPEEIAACCLAAETYGAAALGVRVKDTIKVADEDGFIASTPARHLLWSIQTPQAFKREELLEAHREAREQGRAATDDAMLLEQLGRKVAIVEGSYSNLKITTPEDLPIAALLLSLRLAKEKEQ